MVLYLSRRTGDSFLFTSFVFEGVVIVPLCFFLLILWLCDLVLFLVFTSLGASTDFLTWLWACMSFS